MTEQNICQKYFHNVNKSGDLVAILYKDENNSWQELKYKTFGEKVRWLAFALMDLGIKSGDQFTIVSKNRKEWPIADLSILSMGCISSSLLPTCSSDSLKYTINLIKTKVVVLENIEQFRKIEDLKSVLPSLKYVILMDANLEMVNNQTIFSLDTLIEKGKNLADRWGDELQVRINKIGAQDVAMMAFTSGTTSQPKAVMLTHDNIIFFCQTFQRLLHLHNGFQSLAFLPIAVTRLIDHYIVFYLGGAVSLGGGLDTFTNDVGEVRPKVMMATALLFEKIYKMILSEINKNIFRKRMFDYIRNRVSKYYLMELKAEKIPIFSRLKYKLFKQIVSKGTKKFTGGDLKFFVCGGAPLSKEIAEFFFSLGVLILEGYGSTECSSACSLNTPEDFKFGTVGKIVPDVEVRIDKDGEILVRGRSVFSGYFENVEETRKTLINGWLRTGDLGCFDEEGYLIITGRKKELIVMASGLKIVPDILESKFKEIPYLKHIMVYGEHKEYLVALITLDMEEVGKKFGNGVLSDHNDTSSLVYNELAKAIGEINQKVSPHECIKAFKVMPQDFSAQKGELTPLLKLRRNIIAEKYQSFIRTLYAFENEKGGKDYGN